MADEQTLALLGARRIITDTDLNDLVLPKESRERLGWVEGWLTQPPFLFREWGLSRYIDGGFRALFRGPSGTGKSMAAIAIGRSTARPLYSIDLGAVESKHVAETEKKLGQLFQAADEANAILLFDEADALSGKRSEVGEAHDRYANMGVNYLLRRLEPFQGLAILTTNRSCDLDEDSISRIDVMVEFPRPDGAAREQIWRQLLGSVKLHPGTDVDAARLAKDFELSGAEILRAVRMASWFAASDDRNLDMELLRSAASERAQMRTSS
jgi:SpoVK/Ycf46/Vps4 family AAA+-type ATPase